MSIKNGIGGLFVAEVPGAPPPAPVTSVFGRTGAVVAMLGDYSSSLITNLSTVAGATVTAALDTLAMAIVNILTAAPPVNVTKSPAAVGVATTAARADHKHDVSTAAPVATGTANAEGVATTLARSDHVHASPQLTAAAPVNVTKSAAVVGVATDCARADHKHDVSTAAPVAVGTANAEGVATTLARSDHVHEGLALTAAAPVDVTKAAAAVGVSTTAARSDHKHDVTTAAPVATGTANAEGVATTLARSDHVHASPQLTAAAPVNVTKSAAVVGVATDSARADHKHDVSTAAPVATGTANAEGVATTLARSDHVHASPQLTAAAPVNVTKSAAAVGVATDSARADHKHDVSTAAPVSVGTANAEGVATTLARSDHVHASLPFVVQSLEIARTTSTSTSSGSYVSLLSGGITLTAGRFLCFTATVGCRTSGIVLGNGEVFLEIRFNGTTYRSTAQTVPGNGQESLSITGRVAVGSSGLVAGANTIELRWRSTNATVNVNPATDGEHAAIQLIELSA